MSKQHTKTNESDRNKTANLEMGAVSFERNKKLDSEFYEKKYPDMKFLWPLDNDGSVEKWLRAGASIQKDESGDQFMGETHGYKAKNRKGYVSVIAGTDHGAPYEHILMKISKKRYEELITDPKHQRNKDIRDAMGRGVASSDDRDGSTLETYAANTPTGGVGFEQIGGKAGFNQIVNK